MRLTVPDYYDRFRCIASRCTDNCCICLLYTSDAADD